ncbi:MAG: polysaccharide deacetylase family protein [Candidatus Marinimicrobia bacterium]|nr:polysaccharide deacetylase family protein [Candidatus Neomarinimicrobiota bacterium]
MYKLITTLLITLSLAFAQTKEICLTFDDLPVVGLRQTDISLQRPIIDKLTGTLNRYAIPAIGFVNACRFYSNGQIDSQKIDLVNRWLDAGLEIGNHAYSHIDYNKVSCREFTADLLKGESLIKELAAEHGKSIRYFRHPFLHRGNTKEKVDSLATFLAEHGYREAPVTIDNTDYLFNAAYDSAIAKKDSVLMKTIGAEYVAYQEKKLAYFENQSLKLFDYNMRQIFLLHANAINADYVDELAEMILRHNYRFVTIDRVLEDKAYLTPDTFYKTFGISWLDRWALTAGKKGEFFRDEPRTPEFILNLAGVDSE